MCSKSKLDPCLTFSPQVISLDFLYLRQSLNSSLTPAGISVYNQKTRI